MHRVSSAATRDNAAFMVYRRSGGFVRCELLWSVPSLSAGDRMESYMGQFFRRVTTCIAVNRRRLRQGRTSLLWRCKIDGGPVWPFESLAISGIALPGNVGQGTDFRANQEAGEFLAWMWFYGHAVIGEDHVLTIALREPRCPVPLVPAGVRERIPGASVQVAFNKRRILAGHRALLWQCRITGGPPRGINACVVSGRCLPGNHGLGIDHHAVPDGGTFPAWVWFSGDVTVRTDEVVLVELRT